jgi:hypothetical protein
MTAEDTIIRPFQVGFPEAELTELRRRVNATRWPERETVTDSSADLAAFMLDHGDGTGQPGLVEQALQGNLASDLTRDDILDNITLYWLTNTGISAARLYWENKADFSTPSPLRSRLPSASSPTSSTKFREAGPSAPIPTTSSTTTRSTKAATSPPGNNQACSPPKCGPPSGHCADATRPVLARRPPRGIG